MIEAYCPKCESFTPLIFDQVYEWKGTDRLARNLMCTECGSTLSILRGDALGAHALQKMAELAFYASPTLLSNTPTAKSTRSGKRNRRLKLVP